MSTVLAKVVLPSAIFSDNSPASSSTPNIWDRPARTGCSAPYALSSPYSSKAEINGQTTDKMAHQTAIDNSTMIISAAHSGRTVSR
jgi:hypothetical protein